MTDYLVFRLYGALASWGDIAVGEVRPSASHPSRSQILGLLAAALGIKRTDKEKLENFFAGYDMAEKILSQGTLLHDYHTVQVPKSGKTVYSTRKDELEFDVEKINTILSSREYYCDAETVISLRCRNTSSYSLEELQSALRYPKFLLYLGRKSCPLSLPLYPQIITAGGFKESLDKVVFPELSSFGKLPVASVIRYYWDGDAGDMKPSQILERYDQPVDKIRWQFTPRTEKYLAEGEDL